MLSEYFSEKIVSAKNSIHFSFQVVLQIDKTDIFLHLQTMFQTCSVYGLNNGPTLNTSYS